ISLAQSIGWILLLIIFLTPFAQDDAPATMRFPRSLCIHTTIEGFCEPAPSNAHLRNGQMAVTRLDMAVRLSVSSTGPRICKMSGRSQQ
ncbi:MAG: hypothetical protein IJ234_08210, partial [Clostridia bacterium]|nr:hypothetical protein [Clostridia bacterium]